MQSGTEITVTDIAGSTPPIIENRRFGEVIGGHSADIWENRIDASYSTGARWNKPKVWLDGVARSLIAADVELTIFRTVRFPSA